MSPTERRLHHLANLLVGGTGLVYLYMAWLLPAPDEWAVVNHPWQPTVQHLHVLVAPLLVFALGVLWRAHILAGLRRAMRRRLTGLLLLGLIVPMAGSGYALQVATDETWRAGWAWVHGGLGALWAIGYLGHVVVGPRSRKGDDER